MSEEPEEQLFDFTKKPKTKKPKKETVDKKAVKQEDQLVDTYKDPYKYEQMLERLMGILKTQSTTTTQNQKLNFPSIKLEIVGNRRHNKYVWKNFGEYPNLLNRPADHLKDYFAKQLSLDPILTEEGVLKLEGRALQVADLQNNLIKYIHEFVKCPLCLSTRTQMVKDSTLRTFVIMCDNCKATRALDNIKANRK